MPEAKPPVESAIARVERSPRRHERRPAPASAGSRVARHAGWHWYLIAVVLVFALLVGANRELLRSPPFFDYASSLWLEANWLVEHDFDYRRLVYQEPTLFRGGSKAYVTSVLPTLLALLMKSTSSPADTLLVYHLFYLLAGSVVAVMLYAALAREVGRGAAALVTLAAMTCPLYAAQMGMVGMEWPLTVFVLATALAVGRGRLIRAAAWSLMAFFMKATGAIATMALAVYLIVYGAIVYPRLSREAKRRFRQAALVVAGVLTVELALMKWSGMVEAQNEGVISSIFGLLMAVVWSPDLVAVCVLSVAVLLGRAAYSAVRLAKASDRPEPTGTAGASGGVLGRWRDAMAGVVEQRAMVVFSLIFLAGTSLAMGRILAVPRYFVVLVPTIFYLAGVAWFGGSGRKLVPALATVALIALNLANRDGRFYPSIEAAVGEEMAHVGSFQERSREYLNDHRANIAAMHLVAERYADVPIVTDYPFCLFLALPRLGYVERPLRVYNMGWFRSPGVGNMRQLLEDNPERPVVVGLSYFNRRELRDPATVPGEVLFYDERSPNLVVYRLDTPTDAVARRARYRELWLPPAREGTPDDFLNWAARRLHHELPHAALEVLRRGVQRYPQHRGLAEALKKLEAMLDDERSPKTKHGPAGSKAADASGGRTSE